MVAAPGDWPWSSYWAMVGQAPAPGWLEADAVPRAFAEERTAPMAEAYRTGTYSMQAIAEHFAVSRLTVSRAIKRREGRKGDS